MNKGIFKLLVVIVAVLSLCQIGEAADTAIERDLQYELRQSKMLTEQAGEKLKAGESAQNEISAILALSENVRASHLLLQEKFKLMKEDIMTRGGKAEERQRAMEEEYLKALSEYLDLIERLQQSTISGRPLKEETIRTIEALKSLLSTILPRSSRQIIGSLPYRNLNYPSKEPYKGISIKPAYKGGDKAVRAEDTESTEEAPISKDIATLAQSLKWSPVLIYEYVKNTIDTEWYWGCTKGAEETLRQKSGNDCDQATLLAALLRASGFPVRYIRGTIEFFPDIESVRNNLGIEDPAGMAEYFQKSGIPFKPIITGGKISNFQIEHIWIESRIPYGNYRGAIIDENDPTWLGLDTSIKVKGYEYNNPMDIFQQSEVSDQLSAMKDEYLSAIQTQTPLEYLKEKLSALSNQHTAEDYKLTRTLIPQVLGLLPNSMQFLERNITNEYTKIPDELKHKVRFMARRKDTVGAINESPFFDITFDAMKLSNRQISIDYEPETVEDQEIIDSYGGLGDTPAYLVRLRPVLRLNRQRLIVGRDGLPMGKDYDFMIEVISPNGTERVESRQITGNIVSIGITAQKAIDDRLSAISEGDDVETMLSKEAYRYIDRWNKAEEELASLFHLKLSRPIPNLVMTGGVIDVTYLLDVPHEYVWKGVFVDASLRAVGVILTLTKGGEGGFSRERQKTFMTLSGLQGSILENRLFEDDLGVDSISTAKLFQAADQQSAVGGQLIIDKGNLDNVLPGLDLDYDIKEDIANSVNQNLVVHLPQADGLPLSAVSYKDWTGTGYIKESPNTGEAGYMLTGMIAGGMTAVSPDKWTDQSLREKFDKANGAYKTIIITSPKSGTLVSTPYIEVSGTVLDKSARVEVNGVPAVVEGKSFTATGIMLTDGVNKITATATNEAGKTGTYTVYITCRLPILTYITFPYDRASLSVMPVDVEGVVSDPAASVEVNGVMAAVSTDGRFIAKWVAMSEGINQITAKASKSDGHEGSYTISVNYKAASVSPMALSITSPTGDDTINRPSVTVRGTITTSADEVSLKVNGVVADIYGDRFVANNVPLKEGSNVIIANALDSNGAVARAEVSVMANTTMPYVILNANITSGIPALTTYFSVSTEIPNIAASYQIDFEGDGVIDYIGDTFEDISHAYTEEGIYYPTLTVTDDQGNTYSDTIAITVLNKEKIDTLLKAKWERMKGALSNKDVESAISYFLGRSQKRYRAIFSEIIDLLPAIIADMQPVEMIWIENKAAQYRIRRTEPEGLVTYYIYFYYDENGRWEIQQF